MYAFGMATGPGFRRIPRKIVQSAVSKNFLQFFGQPGRPIKLKKSSLVLYFNPAQTLIQLDRANLYHSRQKRGSFGP